MHTPISRTVGVKLESHFTDGAVLLFKDWDNVLSSESMRNEPKLRILRRLRKGIAWIGNDESSGTTKDRVSVTDEALIGVVPSAQPVGIGSNLRKDGI
jgi:hypothetical protein